jgi:alpha-methylacyl-CoA racemase
MTARLNAPLAGVRVIEDWPVLIARMTKLFLSQPRQHGCALLEGIDVCFAPVLSLDEASLKPHSFARGTLARSPSGATRSHAAPRFKPLPGVTGP